MVNRVGNGIILTHSLFLPQANKTGILLLKVGIYIICSCFYFSLQYDDEKLDFSDSEPSTPYQSFKREQYFTDTHL